jgi:hypothetical protein
LELTFFSIANHQRKNTSPRETEQAGLCSPARRKDGRLTARAWSQRKTRIGFNRRAARREGKALLFDLQIGIAGVLLRAIYLSISLLCLTDI